MEKSALQEQQQATLDRAGEETPLSGKDSRGRTTSSVRTTAAASSSWRPQRDESAFVIQCPSCQTKFALDPQVIEGVEEPKFHCSRCDQVFSAAEAGVLSALQRQMKPVAPTLESAEMGSLRAQAAKSGVDASGVLTDTRSTVAQGSRIEAQSIEEQRVGADWRSDRFEIRDPDPRLDGGVHSQGVERSYYTGPENRWMNESAGEGQHRSAPTTTEFSQIPLNLSGEGEVGAYGRAEHSPSLGRSDAKLAPSSQPSVSASDFGKLGISTQAPDGYLPAPDGYLPAPDGYLQAPDGYRAEDQELPHGLAGGEHRSSSQERVSSFATSPQSFSDGAMSGQDYTSSRRTARGGFGSGALSGPIITSETRGALPAPAPEPDWGGVLSFVLPVFGSLVLLAMAAYALSTDSPRTRGLLARLFPNVTQVAPPGVHIADTRFERVTLDSGETVHMLYGRIANDSTVSLSEVTIEGLAFDGDGEVVDVEQVSASSSLAHSRIKSLPLEMIASLQRIRSRKKFELKPGNDGEFAIAFIGSKAQAAKYYSARVYSAKS